MLYNLHEGGARVRGSVMRYVRFGRGERRLVALPGLSDGLATVRGKGLLLAPPYRRWLDRFTVYIFSRVDALPAGHTIRDMAADQAEAMEQLGIDRASVLGVSQGGMIAQLLAADHPQRVEKLVLAVTAPNANATVRAAVGAWIGMAERGDHRQLMADTAEKSYTEARLRRYRKLYPLLGLVGKPRSYDRFLVNARAILGFDARADLPAIACPTLILGGGIDQTVGPDAASELHARIPGSRLHIYPDLGHAAYEDAPDFYARVFAFLEE